MVKKSETWFLGLILIFYLAITLFLSWLKPFWFDEIFTFQLSQLSFYELFATLGPMDPHPPLNKLIVSISQELFGTTKFATRLPAVIFFGTTLIIVYLICKKLAGSKAAMISPILLMISVGQPYSYEARPYSLVIMLSSMLIYLWLKTPSSNLWTYSLITLVTVALLSSHFYAVFIPMTILFGSFIGYLTRKYLDAKLWISILISYTVLIVYAPAIHRITILDDNNWTSPTPYLLYQAVRSIYMPFVIVLIPSVINWKKCTGALKTFFEQKTQFASGIFAFSMLVLIGYFISFFLGAYHTRYFIGALIACTIVGSLIMSDFSRKQLKISIILIGLVFSYKIYSQINHHITTNTSINELNILLSKKQAGAPIFISDPLCFFQVLLDKTDKEKQDIQYLINFTPEGGYKRVGASDISTFELSKLNPGIIVKDLNEIGKIETTVHYLFCGRPFSYSMKNLQTIREFETISRQGKKILMVSEK